MDTAASHTTSTDHSSIELKRDFNTPSGDQSNNRILDDTATMQLEAPKDENSSVLYRANEVPPWYLTLFLALQFYIIGFVSIAPSPLILAAALCLPLDSVDICNLVNTVLFVSGLASVLQATIGIRLPIIQGPSYSYFLPLLAVFSQERWKCPQASNDILVAVNESHLGHNISMALNGTAGLESDSPWKIRMREAQGYILVSATFQILIGATGAIQLLLRYIGPLTIAPTIMMIGLSLVQLATDRCALHWPISILTIALLILFSQYLRKIMFTISIRQSRKKRSDRQRKTTKLTFPFFAMFSIILSMLLVWLLCFILTVSGALGEEESSRGYHSRTDLKVAALSNTPWFRLPYPFQWGWPTVGLAGSIGMITASTVSIVESVGDYFATARMAGEKPPPSHAINRGILIEGIGCVMTGLWGTGLGTTSYSQFAAIVGITRVGSRHVTLLAGLIFMLLALLGKLGALFVSIPIPIVGGVFMVLFGTVMAVGASNLQFINLNSSRNLFILGSALLIGLSVPDWVQRNPAAISTGNAVLDQILTVLLTTSQFVSGAVGFFFDNTIPGTEDERGIHAMQNDMVKPQHDAGFSNGNQDVTYDLPCIEKFRLGRKITKWLPFCPAYSLKANKNADKH